MKVKALVKCFIDNALREEGVVFEYNGPKCDILEPVDKVADKEAQAKWKPKHARESDDQ